MTTYLFPGQGSQIVGMGDNLFPQFPELVKLTNQTLGYSIVELCKDDKNNQLNNTDFTQPALYVVNVLTYLKKMREGSKKPEFLAGHSLGEYCALFAAGVFDFETGLKLVQKRGELMSQVSGGAMAAIIGLTSAEIMAVIENHHLENIVIANYNSFKQNVISGSSDTIKKIESLFLQAGAKYYVPLKVSGAFHSPYLDAAQLQFADYLKQFKFLPPQVPVIANLTATPYVTDTIALTLSEQINHPVRWVQSMEYLLAAGQQKIEEVGPGNVLANLFARIKNRE